MVPWVPQVWHISAKFSESLKLRFYPSLSSRLLILSESSNSSARRVTKCLTQKLILQTHTCLLPSSFHKDRTYHICTLWNVYTCKKIPAQKGSFIEPFTKPVQTLWGSIGVGELKSLLVEYYIYRTSSTWILNWKTSLSPPKKFLTRTIKLGILRIFGRENGLTFGIFRDHHKNICT